MFDLCGWTCTLSEQQKRDGNSNQYFKIIRTATGLQTSFEKKKEFFSNKIQKVLKMSVKNYSTKQYRQKGNEIWVDKIENVYLTRCIYKKIFYRLA